MAVHPALPVFVPPVGMAHVQRCGCDATVAVGGTHQASYQEARTDARAAVAHELMDHKRTLKLVEQVRDTILAHSLGITELSNHLTALRSFDQKAEQERRERMRKHQKRSQRRRNADDVDTDIFDPDASPMLPPDERATDAGGQPRKPRRVRLGERERRNVDGNPALMRNMVSVVAYPALAYPHIVHAHRVCAHVVAAR